MQTIVAINWIIGLSLLKGSRFPKDTIYVNLMLLLADWKVFAIHVNAQQFSGKDQKQKGKFIFLKSSI